jgi:hypothetical protein
MVGDAQVPLLRIVPVAGRHGKMMTRAFDHIQYCPLAQRRFQDIQIDIRDDTGQVVPFERGRRRESSFFRVFLPPVLFSARELWHLPPSSILSKDNTGTGNGARGDTSL